MFEHDRSIASGEMATRGLYVFKHDSELGNTHAHARFDRLRGARRQGVYAPRAFSDYTVTFDGNDVPPGANIQASPGVNLIRKS